MQVIKITYKGIGDSMGFCPNCGSWVEDGDICGFCGGGSRNVPEEDKYYESEIKKMIAHANELKSQGKYQEAIMENKRIIVEIDRKTDYDTSNDGFSFYSKRDAQEEIKVLERLIEADKRSRYRSVRNELRHQDPEVIAKLRQCAQGDLKEELITLEKEIRKEEDLEGFEFLRMEIIRGQLNVRFIKRGKNFDIIVDRPYYGDGYIENMGGNWTVQDDRLKSYAEFTDLIEKMKREGYEYVGIDPNKSSSYLYDIGDSDYLVMEFLKGGCYHKFIEYDILARRYKTHSEYCNLSELFTTNQNIGERESLIAEIKRVENEFNCSYVKYSWKDSYLLFDYSSGRKLICIYDLSNHRIRKVVYCDDEDFQRKYRIKYHFDGDYYCVRVF